MVAQDPAPPWGERVAAGPGYAVPLPPHRRPSQQLAMVLGAVVLLGIGIVLGVMDQERPFMSARATVERWQGALRAGNVSLLRSDDRLGSQAWTNELVQRLGEQEYTRIVAIFTHAEQLGTEEYNRLRDATIAGGQRAFAQLGADPQQAILRQSHEQWVIEHGFDADPTIATQVPTWQALTVLSVPADLLQRLGSVAPAAAPPSRRRGGRRAPMPAGGPLSQDELNLLANRPENDPAVQADPLLQSLAARRAQVGLANFTNLRQLAMALGEQQFRRLSYGEQRQINGRSESDYILTQGLAALPVTDRVRVASIQAFTDDALANQMRRQLGIALLSPADRADVEHRDKAAFIAAQRAFVEEAGVRLATTWLVNGFRASEYTVETTTVTGHGGRDLIRRESARVVLQWSGLGSQLLSSRLRPPREVLLTWVSPANEWHIEPTAWRTVPADDSDGQGAGATPSSAPAQPTTETEVP